MKHRGREQNPSAFDEIQDFERNIFLNTQWKAFEPAQSARLEFSETLSRIDAFLRPIYESIFENVDWTASWSCEERKWDI